jgi:death-on-curing protein
MKEREVLAIHDRLLAAHGGAAGLRDAGLLQSALTRPRQHYTYRLPSIIELAATYTTGIVGNHPFVDGNKRAGFTVGVVFLELNGYEFKAIEENVIHTVLAIAAGELDGAGYATWLRSNSKKKRKR